MLVPDATPEGADHAKEARAQQKKALGFGNWGDREAPGIHVVMLSIENQLKRMAAIGDNSALKTAGSQSKADVQTLNPVHGVKQIVIEE